MLKSEFFNRALARRNFVSAFIIGFIPIVGYLLCMYFLIEHNTTVELLYVLIFLRNFGYVICSIVLLTNLIKTPFQHFFSWHTKPFDFSGPPPKKKEEITQEKVQEKAIA